MPAWLAYPGRDSNPYGLAASVLTGRCVCQFHHPGTWIRAGALAAATRSVKPPVTSRSQCGGNARIVVIIPTRGGANPRTTGSARLDESSAPHHYALARRFPRLDGPRSGNGRSNHLSRGSIGPPLPPPRPAPLPPPLHPNH